MIRDDVADDRQAQAGPTPIAPPGLIDPVEAFEDPLEITSRYALTVIDDDGHFYQLIREVLVANLHNHSTNICIEVGRQNTPKHVRPSFSELEEALREVKKAAA